MTEKHTIIRILKASLKVVLVVIEHVRTVHAAALLRFLRQTFGRPLAVSTAARDVWLLAGGAAVGVVLSLAVAPGGLQTRVC